MPASSSASTAPAASTVPSWRGVLASIDIGSNSFRLEIGQLSRGRYRRIDYLKETVRLGAGLDAQGLLGEEAAQRGLACLQRFRARLAGIPPRQLRAVATQTLREASNRDAFLARAAEALGHPVEVISGREEARLIYKGVARLQPSPHPRLVIDIGGRSTELIIGAGSVPLQAESFGIGSVSLSMRYFGDGLFTEERFRAAQVAAGAEFEEALETFSRRHWSEALGSSGTAGAVSQILAAAGVTDGAITPEGLAWCMNACVRAGRIDALELPGLKPERRAVLGGGLAILSALSAQFGIETLQPARGALRQGVIFDLQERLDADRDPVHHDLRDDTVAELQQRFRADVMQARRVQAVALQLHRQAQPRAELDHQRELGWAAALHEIGMMVSHHDHHRHSAYLIGHVDAAGFSQTQQRRLADLVLGHRGGLRKIEAALADPALVWQVLALRLAVLLCHARCAPDEPLPRLVAEGRHARLALPAGWADRHPRTLHLLEAEGEAWARAGVLKFQPGRNPS
ncbi:Ppx/GppA phosphatase family protein [Sphaerotilus uruguayifluvii]|uniref:Exopolyphosphatase/guanosine-5'-triphosphate, 3'-diphosphate pyrophosphatase n=1 Tax=Sphaerotilus uruguayifluvii TaxID=2735897 RepID=A0ABX2G2C7_9BURK|nr:Ppx/GppA phosphatase family protein [Leptothrix sp. C29]NRT56463.1 exopolyphosphatase/guanosine-5'-triphosphate,3'-diphosphate pyrophosphatase [Leptothrix sp. C29]